MRWEEHEPSGKGWPLNAWIVWIPPPSRGQANGSEGSRMLANVGGKLVSAPTPRARHLMGGLIPMGAGMGAGMLLGDSTSLGMPPGMRPGPVGRTH